MGDNLYVVPAVPLAARNAMAVTPSDIVDLPQVSYFGLFVTVTGNVKVDMAGSGTAITFTGLAANTVLPIAARRVYSTGTTATILALF